MFPAPSFMMLVSEWSDPFVLGKVRKNAEFEQTERGGELQEKSEQKRQPSTDKVTRTSH